MKIGLDHVTDDQKPRSNQREKQQKHTDDPDRLHKFGQRNSIADLKELAANRVAPFAIPLLTRGQKHDAKHARQNANGNFSDEDSETNVEKLHNKQELLTGHAESTQKSQQNY
jgi:hypothetical protein